MAARSSATLCSASNSLPRLDHAPPSGLHNTPRMVFHSPANSEADINPRPTVLILLCDARWKAPLDELIHEGAVFGLHGVAFARPLVGNGEEADSIANLKSCRVWHRYNLDAEQGSLATGLKHTDGIHYSATAKCQQPAQFAATKSSVAHCSQIAEPELPPHLREDGILFASTQLCILNTVLAHKMQEKSALGK